MTHLVRSDTLTEAQRQFLRGEACAWRFAAGLLESGIPAETAILMFKTNALETSRRANADVGREQELEGGDG